MTTIALRFIQFFVVFASYKLAITLFDPSDYGSLTIFFVIASFFILFSVSPFGNYLHANCIKWQREGILLVRIRLTILIAIVFGVGFSILSLPLIILSNTVGSHFFFIGLYVFGAAIAQTLIALIAIVSSIRFSIIMANLNAFGCLLSSYISVQCFGLEVFNWILGQVIFQLIFSMYLYKQNFNTASENITLQYFKNFLKEGYQFISITGLISILCWALWQSPKVLYSNIFDTVNFGVFMAGFVLAAYVCAGFETLVNMYAQTFFYRKFDPASDEHDGAWVLYLYRIVFCFSAIFAIILPILDQVAIFIFVDAYSDSRKYLLLGLICEYLRIVGGCFIVSGQYTHRPQMNIIPLAVASSFIIFSATVMRYVFNLDLVYLVSALPVGFLLYLVMASYSSQKFKSLAYGAYIFRLCLLIISFPLYICFFIGILYIIPTSEMRLIFDILLFLGSTILWGFLFSWQILGGKSLVKALFSSVD